MDMFSEVNTGTNLPAQIELYATPGNEYHFLFIAKGKTTSPHVISDSHMAIRNRLPHFLTLNACVGSGGGSANKSFLFQQTKAVLNEKKLLSFLDEKIKVPGGLLKLFVHGVLIGIDNDAPAPSVACSRRSAPPPARPTTWRLSLAERLLNTT